MTNVWQNVSDDDILTILHKAGMPEVQQKKELLNRFRINTDEYFDYFRQKNKPSTQSLILGKSDLFTVQNNSNAKELWGRYISTINSIHIIDTSSHYYLTSHANILADILLSEV